MRRQTAPAMFKVGDHVRVRAHGGDVELCGTIASAFEAIAGGRFAYGVMYDDHTPQDRRPFGSAGHSYGERDLEAAPARLPQCLRNHPDTDCGHEREGVRA